MAYIKKNYAITDFFWKASIFS